MGRRRSRSHYLGCLLGGAVGDALGAAIEFLHLSEIQRRFGPAGLEDYAPAYGREGAITDDTQLTLFTAEALIRAHNRHLERGVSSHEEIAHHAYLRWLHTQGERYNESMTDPGWLVAQKELHVQRAPGATCLSALRRSGEGSQRQGTSAERINDSKGCGGVMRVAPAGLCGKDAFDLGCRLAALTHGHPSGYFAAGCFAQLICELAHGLELRDAIARSLDYLSDPEAHEVRDAVGEALALADGSGGSPEAVERLGRGWVAEEALAIAVYCALEATDFRSGVLLAVNHSGDSDSTGSIAGNILGLLGGKRGIPTSWLKRLELKWVISQVAADLWVHFGEGKKPAWARFERDGTSPDRDRYPGN